MSPRAHDRDPAASSWPAQSTGSRAHIHSHSHLQGAAAARSDPNERAYIATPGSNRPVQPWTAASGPSSAYALDAANNSNAQLSQRLDSAPRPPPGTTSGSSVTTSNPQPSTNHAASAARTRIFDPARDLNPKLPNDTSTSPVSPYTSSSSSEASHNAAGVSYTDQRQMGQLFSSATKSSSSSGGSLRQDASPEIPDRFNLEVVEHPICARASTTGDRDRRVINPPPILRLSMNDYDPNNPEDRKRLTWAYNIVICTLWRIPGVDAPQNEWQEVTEDTGRNSRRPEGGLKGTLHENPFIVETPNHDYDEDSRGPPSCYYIFSDLSCRMTGLYRLGFSLVPLRDDFLNAVGSHSPTVLYTWTEPFEVFSAKDFPGVRASSKLLRYLKTKGANVTIKKEKETPKDAARKRARASTATGGSSSTSINVDVKRSRAVLDAQYDGRDAVRTGTGYPGENGPDD